MALALDSKFIPGRPPDKGSFPLDHDGECKEFQQEYIKCLKAHSHDNMSCRYISKQYLQCRMDKGLMEKQPIEALGFVEGHDQGPKDAREFKRFDGKQEKGYVTQIQETGSTKRS